jgi:hypothetical protein
MSQDLDLFQAAEPKTCGNCGARQSAREGGCFCDLKLQPVRDADEACDPALWYPRAEE